MYTHILYSDIKHILLHNTVYTYIFFSARYPTNMTMLFVHSRLFKVLLKICRRWPGGPLCTRSTSYCQYICRLVVIENMWFLLVDCTYTPRKKKGQIRSHTRYTRAVDFLTILKIVVLCVQCLCTISKKYIQVCKCILTIIVWPRSRNLCKLYVYLCGRTFNKWTCVGTHYTWIPNNILCLQY